MTPKKAPRQQLKFSEADVNTMAFISFSKGYRCMPFSGICLELNLPVIPTALACVLKN
jgi:hypothetical protein